MSDDRKLLEAAAAAAGYDFVRHSECGDGALLAGIQGAWRPLVDDGDAFRLAVRLGLTINPYREGVFVSRFEGEEVVGEPFAIMGTPDEAATRRAIVRAAAAIGAQHDA